MAGVVGVGLAVVFGGSGCTPPSAPRPTATATVSGFVSEDEAFRAAEATYRAYVDALNRVDLADPRTFEPVYEWLEGDALSTSKNSFTRMHAEGLSVAGKSTVPFVEPRVAGAHAIVIDVCLDVSDVDIVDPHGKSVVSKSRDDRQPRRLTLRVGATATGLIISSSEPVGSEVCG